MADMDCLLCGRLWNEQWCMLCLFVGVIKLVYVRNLEAQAKSQKKTSTKHTGFTNPIDIDSYTLWCQTNLDLWVAAM